MSKFPTAKRVPFSRTHHGDTFADNYEWLRDKGSPEVSAYLNAQNAHTDAQTKHLSSLQESIFNEIKNRTSETDLSVPSRQGQFWYYTRTVEGKQYGIHCRVPVLGQDDWAPPTLKPQEPVPGEQVLLDGNKEAEGHEFFDLGNLAISADGLFLAYLVDTVGNERYTLRIRDLATGSDTADVIEDVASDIVFSPDGKFVYYSTYDDAWRVDTVWRHTLGATSAPVQIFHEPDEKFWLEVRPTHSRRYVLIEVGSTTTSEYHLLDTHSTDQEFQVVWPRRSGVEYSVEHALIQGEDRLLVLHNDEAPGFELVSVDPKNPGVDKTSARVLVKSSPDVRLTYALAFETFLALGYRRKGLTQVAVIPAQKIEESLDIHQWELTFEEPFYTVLPGTNRDWKQPILVLEYSSLITPRTILSVDSVTGIRTVLKQQQVLGGYDPSRYEQRREWATAPDGALVPVSLVYAKTDTTDPRPLHLEGYGSYEASFDPEFSTLLLPLLDRGVVYAIAHVRGGGEMGRHWYDQGKLSHKKNTFTDFIAVAEHLVSTGQTTAKNLTAEGASAGGLLMGAITNMAPELFAGVFANVPFVDPLTSVLDPSLPLTINEWDEWGNPLHSAEAYTYIKSYSPYENVREGVQYPKILAVTSLNDTRVLYVEPAKWVARLQEVGAPALLKTEMHAGHAGVSGRYNVWRERAFELAWLLDTLGLGDPS
ncbi:S9 family peptidase [Lysinibacter sp. HNR]|uniref:S9 family peptidase n=1 Tax=Lysinibacter sp. HNR TaxID=3031408 RepID=UPI002434DA2A|nr:S9 family peptidase [Lysinibacter sp. HNR]WGD36631.1 S9 family peptidase [Lysinibacter sp. HNR]